MLKRRSFGVGFAAIALFCLAAARMDPVVAEPAQVYHESRSLPAPSLRTGDEVHLRSGGPLMTVDRVEGDQAICHWATEYGELRSGSFPIVELSAPITLPPVDPDQQKDEAAADRYYQSHCPSGVISPTGKFECAY